MSKKTIELARKLLAQHEARDEREPAHVMLENDASDLALALDLANEVLSESRVLRCSGMQSKRCDRKVSRIDRKGFLYCAWCGRLRGAGGTAVRKLSPSEVETLKKGGTIPW
jgi:hypothetical protein